MPTVTELEVVAAVTAYNEEATIGGVIDALAAAPSVGRIRVVDDGSTDGTADLARRHGAEVIRLPRRIPVGEAIMRHLDGLEDECLLLWCDADLVGLRCEHAETLIARYRRGDVTQSLSSRGLPASWPGWMRGAPSRWLWSRAFGPLSGERVLRKSDFERAITLARGLGWKEMMRGYGIVLFLNHYSARFGKGDAISYFDGLAQRQKYEKWGRRSSLEMVGEWGQFVGTWWKIRMNRAKIERAASRMGVETADERR